jgi:hypothetical protein
VAKYDTLVNALWDTWHAVCPQNKDWCLWLDLKLDLVSDPDLQAILQSQFVPSAAPLASFDSSDTVAAKIGKFCRKHSVPVTVDATTCRFAALPQQDGNCTLLFATGADGKLYLSLQSSGTFCPFVSIQMCLFDAPLPARPVHSFQRSQRRR